MRDFRQRVPKNFLFLRLNPSLSLTLSHSLSLSLSLSQQQTFLPPSRPVQLNMDRSWSRLLPPPFAQHQSICKKTRNSRQSGQDASRLCLIFNTVTRIATCALGFQLDFDGMGMGTYHSGDIEHMGLADCWLPGRYFSFSFSLALFHFSVTRKCNKEYELLSHMRLDLHHR